jgi:hypothetical protein
MRRQSCDHDESFAGKQIADSVLESAQSTNQRAVSGSDIEHARSRLRHTGRMTKVVRPAIVLLRDCSRGLCPWPTVP